jgi:hypothetical protein
VTAPAGAVPGPVTVVVQLPGQDATAPERYTYLDDGTGPAVTGLDPDTGPTGGGTVVTVTGRGLAGADAVLFGGVAGRDLTASPDGARLTVTTPAGLPGAVPVAVTLDPGTEVLGARQFTYQPAVAGAAAAAPSGRSGSGLLARTGLPLLAVALVGAALATAGHLIRGRH